MFTDGSWIRIDENGRLHTHLEGASRVQRQIIAYGASDPESPELPDRVVLRIQDDKETLVVDEDPRSEPRKDHQFELHFPGLNGNSWV